MKILTIARLWPRYKGVFESRAGVIDRLDKHRFRTIHIYIAKNSGNPNQFEQAGQMVYYLAGAGRMRQLNPMILWRLIELLKKEKVDILHCHKHKSTVYGALASLFVRPLVVIAHVHGIHRTRNWRRRLFNRFLFKRTHKILTVGQATARDVIETNPGVDRQKVFSLGNSITVDRFEEVSISKEEAKKALQLPENAFVFGTVTRLTPVKGNDHLIEAFHKVRQQGFSAHLVIAGTGRAQEDLQQLALRLGIRDCVHFLGYRTDIPVVLKSMDCFIIASVGEEGLPRALIEAMSAGVPVIGTRISGIPEILDEGKYGLLVDPGDSRSLAQAMIQTAQQDPVRQGEILQRARRRVREEYCHDAVAARLENMYGTLAVQEGILQRYYLISYPKSGRTWLRLMLAKFFQTHFSLQVKKEDFLKLESYGRYNRAIPSLLVDHDPDHQTTLNNRMEELRGRLGRYKNSKVIFLVRDPRDVLVSHYFQETRRPKKDQHDFFKGSISEFIRNPFSGVDAILKFCNLWAECREVPEEFLLVSYEDLHNNTAAQLRRILEFLQIRDVPPAELEQTISFAAFENMQKLEREDSLRSSMLRPGDVNDPNSYKTRRGVVEGFYDYLPEEDVDYLNEKLAREMDPFFGYSFGTKAKSGQGPADSAGHH